ncbi:hypothetical protein PGT21_013944 [Puccinia graminis f. sp. tritici]|uniref:Uncharacterized protein n=1 Tax=Puccinia graminis f. sp. tritici TaxID=56615 RepID=A0A5B0S4N2_PUCGR|nr:hypothetical protein PGT21_013944 [Puccinia graminis f. sp. tritici]KAA1132073.1 hypothetical protein PGTUg99_036802 [Puccinia graminis f. sp. tritici]
MTKVPMSLAGTEASSHKPAKFRATFAELHEVHGLHEGRRASASSSITTELIIIKAEEWLREKAMQV